MCERKNNMEKKMKISTMLSILLLVFLLVGCGQKPPEFQYPPDSDQYKFFKTLSDSLGISYLNPEKPVALVTTSNFTVWTFDVMPGIYVRFKRFENNLSGLPADQLRSTIEQGASGEADKKEIY